MATTTIKPNLDSNKQASTGCQEEDMQVPYNSSYTYAHNYHYTLSLP